ncbi:MAG: DUF547 domain-containing protein [Pseudomonadota bacterium]
MHRFFLTLAALFIAETALAAPIWIERRFVPEAELVDPRYTTIDETSETVVDHTAWAAFLSAYVRVAEVGPNRVAYGSVSDADRAALDGYLDALQTVDVAGLAREEALAYWINLYNAATIALVLDAYPIEGIRKINVDGDGPWDTPVATVSGRALTLNEIEHGIIRPVFKDERIHYAVNCASVGCPSLAIEPFEGARLDAQLDAAARAYVNDPRGVAIEDGDLTVSKIFGWYREDFAPDEAGVVDYLKSYAEPALAAALDGFDDIDGYAYDWSLNDAP